MQGELTLGDSRSRAILAGLGTKAAYLFQPLRLIRSYDRDNLGADFIAGLTVAVVLLPQAIAYALIAELPPQMGLFTAIIAAVVGALWGSSNHLHTGPTNAASLLVLSVLLTFAAAGTPEYWAAAGLMAVMVGVFRLVMGFAGLGMLVNFVSDSVIVGFTAGAGVLISLGQIRNLLGLPIPSSPSLITTSQDIAISLPQADPITVALGIGTLVLIILLRRFAPRLPAPLIGMIVSAAAVAVLGLDQLGVAVIGELPRSLPPLTELPLLNFELIGQLSTGALAVSVIGLIEAMSIARSIASQTGQRLDSNQEFVGQGLANIACGFFSGYTCSGSFTRSAVNFESGGRTPMASAFSGGLVLVAMFLLAKGAAYVPRTALAAVLIVTAYGMIDRQEIARIWAGTQGDMIIMVVTILATLLLPLQFAVLTGIMMSLAYYVWRTSVPRVHSVVPDSQFRHFVRQVGPKGAVIRPACPQLGILDILGDLYFGAVNNIEDAILENLKRNPDQRHLMLRMHSVTQVDISGIHTLEAVVRTYRNRGGDVFIVRAQQPVLEFMQSTGFYETLGPNNFLDEDDAIRRLFHQVLDPAVCIYECDVRVFMECQNLPKQTLPEHVTLPPEISARPVPAIPPEALWSQLRGAHPPLVYDVREPREYQRAHIPQAQTLPLPRLLIDGADVPRDQPVVMVCRTGRRSTRATHALQEQGYDNVSILEGGMLSWEAAGLLEAVDSGMV